jgi:hypothetical protein
MNFIKTFEVLQPSGITIVRKPNTGLYHTINTASCGFKADFYLTPANVSFSAVSIKEMGCSPTTASGYLSFKSNEKHKEWNWAHALNEITAGLGTHTYVEDKIESDDYTTTPYGVGVFVWNIPVHFRVGTNDSGIYFATNIHKEVIDANGKLTISKGGISEYKNAGDATSSY